MTVALDPQQSPRVIAENELLLFLGQRFHLRHDFYRLFVRDVEAVVASHHDAVGADEVDEILQDLFAVADRVISEALEIFARRPRNDLALAARMETAVETPVQDRQRTARVRQ